MKKKYKKALALGIGATLGAKFLGAKADAAKKLLASQQTDTGSFDTQMANDTALAKGNRKIYEAGEAAKKAKKENSFLGKAKKFLKEEVFTTDPKTKITIPLPKFKGNTKGYGDFTFTDQYGNPQGAKTGKMIKANNGMMVESRGNKLARTKITKLS